MARHRQDIRRIVSAALVAADARTAVRGRLSRRGDELLVDGIVLPRVPGRGVLLAGAGKAAVPMAQEAAHIAGELLAGGVVIGPSGDVKMPGVLLLPGAHPLPDERSLAAADALEALLTAADEGDLVLFMLSGGASAMVERPVAGVSLTDLRLITAAMMKAGAPIAELNTVRRGLSETKGGGLLAMAAPAHVVTLAISDVVGDSPLAIGSGPTVSSTVDAPGILDLLAGCELEDSFLARIAQALTTVPPRPASVGHGVGYHVVARVQDAVRGAARCAEQLGYRVHVQTEPVEGPAHAAGQTLSRRAQELALSGREPTCIVAGGETSVVVRGAGRGGRNQEAALAACLEIDGEHGVTVAMIGTDGRDGPMPVAGAMADGETASRGRRLGCDPAGFLAANDSYTFFAELGDLLTTGPTGTNVMDLHIALIGHPDD